MKHILVFLALLISAGPLFAADNPKQAGDPFAGAFFPPDLVLLARDRIALTQKQQDTLRERMEKTQPRSDELRAKLERENAALTALAKKEHIEEKLILAQLDKVIEVERELRQLHVGLAVGVKNLLTPEQQAKLREISKDGVAPLGGDIRKRLTEKVERVKAGAHKWVESGRDPSDILLGMEEKFKPLLETGKLVEAELELDRVLEQLKK
jgi:Spy/CpxP family protein refolding chaperone